MWARNQTTYSQHDFVTGLYTEALIYYEVDRYQFGFLSLAWERLFPGAEIRSIRRRRSRIHP